MGELLMQADNKIRMHVEELFYKAPKSHRTIELKEELIANLQDRYADLVSQGKDEELAYNIAISGIGDIDELIRGLQEQYIFDPEAADRRRRKSAAFTSVAVGMYIFGLVPMILLANYGFEIIGAVTMFTVWAIATALIVYNSMSKPKYKKHQETMVEDFKEWASAKKNTKALRDSLNSIVWMSAVIIFLGGGFLFNKFNLFWLVFLLAAVVNKIINLVFKLNDYDGRDK